VNAAQARKAPAGDTELCVLVVEDHPIVARALAESVARLAPAARIDCVGSVEDALAQLANTVRSARRQLVLLDLGLPGCTGLSALLEILSAMPQSEVAIVSANAERAAVRAAIDSGARAYLPKSMSADAFAGALAQFLESGRFVPDEIQASAGCTLSPRQRDVMLHLGRGKTNKEIALALGVEVSTVKRHLEAIRRKLEVSGSTRRLATAVGGARPGAGVT
jgi:DNA-binding NarL/FixJ family response regulator